MDWRWDQGRLDYFQFEEIQHIANALIANNGKVLPQADEADTLREVLAQLSERPFAPTRYKVWRNYKRVFGCEMLAADVNGLLVCTELCELVNAEKVLADDYFFHIARNFSYPSPVFIDYDPTLPQVFPICAIIKFLISEFINQAKPFVTIDEIIDRVKGNEVNGSEPLSAYSGLRETGLRIAQASDEYRQIREMIRFIAQFSFLKWDNPNLFLDVRAPDEAVTIAAILDPQKLQRIADPSMELLRIGKNVRVGLAVNQQESSTLNPFDLEFTEGSKALASHLKIERSSKLKELYFAKIQNPSVCDMCATDTLDHYPWALRLIELHHILPLSSSVRVEKRSTSLRDIVGLCPSCHRATHKFYSQWLRENDLKDFRGRAESKSIYNLVKADYVS